MIRDKSYLRLENQMLLNVTGDQHPHDRVYASLKYIGRHKWKVGYQAAVRYLSEHDPDLVDPLGFISVPRDRIVEVLDPFERWQELRQAISRGETLSEDKDTLPPASLHREALELADQLHQHLGLTDFGITDSLLWGNGHAESDIDLVVRGRENARRILLYGNRIYQQTDLERPSPELLRAPYGTNVADWPRILDRKLHMGCFRGRFFSIRVVNAETELAHTLWKDPEPHQNIKFEIADHSDSLAFPAIYRNERGDELVDYSVVYEGVFRPGDCVVCQCERLRAERSGLRGITAAGADVQHELPPTRVRYVIQNVMRF